MMNIQVKANNIKIPHVAEALLYRKAHKIEKMLHEYPADRIKLEVETEKKNRLYLARFIFSFPDGGCELESSDRSLVNAYGEGFKKIFKFVSTFKIDTRRTEKGKKHSAAKQKDLESSGASSENRLKLADFIIHNYEKFHNYAMREIRFRCYQGQTDPGDISVIDVLDESLLAVIENFYNEFDEEKARRLYYAEISKVIGNQLRPGGISLVPVGKSIKLDNIDSNYYEYYQPDEVIKVEDILIDSDSIGPDEQVEYKELEKQIDKLLAQLPADWREAFILTEREGLPPQAIAENRGTSLNSVLNEIDMSREFLRKKLQDSGFEWRT